MFLTDALEFVQNLTSEPAKVDGLGLTQGDVSKHLVKNCQCLLAPPGGEQGQRVDCLVVHLGREHMSRDWT